MRRYKHDSDPDIPSWDALKQCFDENIETFIGKITVGITEYDLDGQSYFGYKLLGWEEIEQRKPIVGWFSGFVVTWTDTVINYSKHKEWTPSTNTRIKLATLPPEERERIDRFFDAERRYTGSRNEVKKLCSQPKVG